MWLDWDLQWEPEVGSARVFVCKRHSNDSVRLPFCHLHFCHIPLTVFTSARAAVGEQRQVAALSSRSPGGDFSSVKRSCVGARFGSAFQLWCVFCSLFRPRQTQIFAFRSDLAAESSSVQTEAPESAQVNICSAGVQSQWTRPDLLTSHTSTRLMYEERCPDMQKYKYKLQCNSKYVTCYYFAAISASLSSDAHKNRLDNW